MKIWLERLKLESLLTERGAKYIYNNGRLCAAHFDDKYFTSTRKEKLHKVAAIPVDLRDVPQLSPVSGNSVEISEVCEATPHMKPKSTPAQPVLQRTPKTREILNLRSKLSKAKKGLFKQKKKNNVLEQLKDMLTSRQYDFVASQIRAGRRKPKGRRWTSKDKAFALNICHHSPAAYKLLRRFLAFPCRSTLRRCTGNIAKDDGFCPILQKALSEKAKKMKDIDKFCTLVFDEMSIKSALSYNATLDIVDGFESGNTENPKMATQAMVFMLRGVTSNWKQVMFVFFCIFSIIVLLQ